MFRPYAVSIVFGLLMASIAVFSFWPIEATATVHSPTELPIWQIPNV